MFNAYIQWMPAIRKLYSNLYRLSKPYACHGNLKMLPSHTRHLDMQVVVESRSLTLLFLLSPTQASNSSDTPPYSPNTWSAPALYSLRCSRYIYFGNRHNLSGGQAKMSGQTATKPASIGGHEKPSPIAAPSENGSSTTAAINQDLLSGRA